MGARRGSLSAECRLVFHSAAASPDRAELAGAVAEVRDWTRALLMAERERAVSRLWQALDDSARRAMPEDAAQHLSRSAAVTDFRMAHLHQRLCATLGGFTAERVPVVLLKGAAMGAAVYDSFAARPMLDVDLLVRREDVARAVRIVLATGWKERGNPVVERLLQGHHHLPPFLDVSGMGLRLELHTALMVGDNQFRLSDDDVWMSATRVGGEYGDALAPDPHLLLLHACIHFAWSHTVRFGAWRTFSDAAALVVRDRIQWGPFVELAKRSRGATSCYWTLRLARRMSELPVPDAVLSAIAPPTPEPLRRALERHFIADIALGESPQCPSVTLSHGLWRVAIRPRWSGLAGADRFRDDSTWDEEVRGVKPDPPSARVVRHVTGMPGWWRFVSGTLSGRARQPRA